MASWYPLNGYDEKRFVTPVSGQLKCSICTGVLNNPKGCRRKHFFCSNCITRHLYNVSYCPVCHVPLTPDTLQNPPQELIDSLSALCIHCDNKERGCNEIVLLKDLQDHVRSCQFQSTQSIASIGDDSDYAYPGMKEQQEKRELLEVTTEAFSKPLQQPSSPIEEQDVIVLGGRVHEGQSLTTAERYIFREGRWVEIPPMNTPRSFQSSVLLGNAIIVSGGDTGDAVTDSIETMNLDETPLQWMTSAAKLPAPLSGHRTVVYAGKLLVIGGYDGNTGRNSDQIYEVSLYPPYTARVLCSLPQRKGWHGAELVNGKIFILGGGRNPGLPTNHVFIYDPVWNTCEEMPNLPYPVHGMATVHWRNKVILVGGMDGNDDELDDVIMYDTQSGRTRRLPRMNKRRGGCSAVITADTLVALGGLSGVENPNTVECYNFRNSAWNDMPPTREAREFGTAVSSPVNVVFE